MKLFHSSRLRIAMISVLTSGMVLVAFGSVTWWILSRNRLAMLDSSLGRMGHRVASHSQRFLQRGAVKMMVDAALGTDRVVEHFYLATDKEGEVLQSYHWPKKLDYTGLQPGEDEIESPRDPFRRRPPPFRMDGERNSRPPGDRERPKQFEATYQTVAHGGEQLRIGVFGNRELTFRFGANLGQYAEDIRQIRNAFLLSLPGALLLIALGSLYVAHKAFGPVKLLSHSMQNLSIQGVHERLDTDSVDAEYRQITQAYNEMLERLERSFSQATRFSADASHELKTPLAIMRGKLEQALARCPTDSDEQRTYTALLEETDRQQIILESLLLLSRADGGKLELTLEDINVSAWLEALIEDAGILAEERDIRVESAIEPNIHASVDPILLQRAVHNLFTNAVRYNHEGGTIHCALTHEGDRQIRLVITNTGETILRQDQERVFDRFVRGPSARAGGERRSGLGLGLSLVREIARAHRGTVALESSDDSRTTFVLTLPVAARG